VALKKESVAAHGVGGSQLTLANLCGGGDCGVKMDLLTFAVFPSQTVVAWLPSLMKRGLQVSDGAAVRHLFVIWLFGI